MLVQLIYNGLTFGAVLALCALGLSLISGVLKIFNFAYGDYLSFGAFAAFVVNVTAGLHLAFGALIAIVGTALIAVALEFVLWRPLRKRGTGTVSILIVTFGLGLIIRNLLSWRWGNAPRRYDNDVFQSSTVLGLRVSVSSLVVIAAAFIACTLVAILLLRTSIGRQMRAMADNHDLAEVAGVRTQGVVVATWAIAGAAAGLAGVLLALQQSSFTPNTGVAVFLPIFAAVVLGGIGDAFGALAGGMAIGLAIHVSTWDGFFGGVPSGWTPAVAFVTLVAVLIVRPEGVFGRSTA